jgi:hypothetical protein
MNVSTLNHPNAPLLNRCTAQIFFFYYFALIFSLVVWFLRRDNITRDREMSGIPG